jgi:hypothetical protein
MKAAIIILLIAIFHILPIVGIVLIAINVEPIYHAIGTAIVLCLLLSWAISTESISRSVKLSSVVTR